MVGIITFTLVYIGPGDPAAIIAGDEATPEILERIRHDLGFDRPFLVQMGEWFLNLLRGDLGTSYFSGREITFLITPRLQPTLSLGFQVVVLSTIIGISAGMLAAWKAGTRLDKNLMVFAVLGFATPGFWLAFLTIWVFAVNLGWFPVIGYKPLSAGLIPHLHSMFLPVMVNSDSRVCIYLSNYSFGNARGAP